MAELYGDTPAPPASNTGGLSDNVVGGLAYFTIVVAIVFLFVAPYNRRESVRFHCFQSIFLSIVWIVSGLFSYFGSIGSIISMILSLVLFVVWLIALIQAFRGVKFMIPGIGPFAQQYASKA